MNPKAFCSAKVASKGDACAQLLATGQHNYFLATVKATGLAPKLCSNTFNGTAFIATDQVSVCGSVCFPCVSGEQPNIKNIITTHTKKGALGPRARDLRENPHHHPQLLLRRRARAHHVQPGDRRDHRVCV